MILLLLKKKKNFEEGKLYVEIKPRYQNMVWEFDESFQKSKYHGLKRWISLYHITKIEKLENTEKNNVYYFHFKKTHLTLSFIQTLKGLIYTQKVAQIPIEASEINGDSDTSIEELNAFQKPNSVLVPSAFSPNNDGSNDYFEVVGQNLIAYELQIYNRLGNPIHKINEENTYGWDGNINGRTLSPGIYAYYGWAKFEDGETKILKGHLTLLK